MNLSGDISRDVEGVNQIVSPISSPEDTFTNSLLMICASCCKGPAQGGLPAEYQLDRPLQKCAGCKSIYFCSKECQKKAWKVHKTVCRSFLKNNKIPCVIMTNPSDCRQIYLDPFDPIFDQAVPSQAIYKCGIPLRLAPLKPGTDNEWCTYLLIDPITGFAPLEYQNLGEVLLCRFDRLPITPLHVYQLGDFITTIIDQFGGDEDETICDTHITRENFVNFLTDHMEELYFNELGVGW